VTFDWYEAELDVEQIDERFPRMGTPYCLLRGCPETLGRMACVKRHLPSHDPVHVAAHHAYGVTAVWITGYPPQINTALARRVEGRGWNYLFGDLTFDDIVLVEPHEEENA
jgi:hypothetical protein